MRCSTDEPVAERAVAEAQPAIFTVIDDALLRMQGRSLLSGVEVVDFLLDLRSTVALELQLESLRVPVAS